jgi:hypothetical protein
MGAPIFSQYRGALVRMWIGWRSHPYERIPASLIQNDPASPHQGIDGLG